VWACDPSALAAIAQIASYIVNIDGGDYEGKGNAGYLAVAAPLRDRQVAAFGQRGA